MKPLFLNPPTFEDFDGGAGARYQASREVTSFWYPTWLCFSGRHDRGEQGGGCAGAEVHFGRLSADHPRF